MIIQPLGVAQCINTQTRVERDIIVDSMHKYRCFSNEDWGLLLQYVELLERYVPRKVRRELHKIIEVNEKQLATPL